MGCEGRLLVVVLGFVAVCACGARTGVLGADVSLDAGTTMPAMGSSSTGSGGTLIPELDAATYGPCDPDPDPDPDPP